MDKSVGRVIQVNCYFNWTGNRKKNEHRQKYLSIRMCAVILQSKKKKKVKTKIKLVQN